MTQWSRVLLEKLTAPQPNKNFSAFYGNRIFNSAFTRARHLFLSSARLIRSMPPPQSQLPLKWVPVTKA